MWEGDTTWTLYYVNVWMMTSFQTLTIFGLTVFYMFHLRAQNSHSGVVEFLRLSIQYNVTQYNTPLPTCLKDIVGDRMLVIVTLQRSDNSGVGKSSVSCHRLSLTPFIEFSVVSRSCRVLLMCDKQQLYVDASRQEYDRQPWLLECVTHPRQR